MADDLYNDPEFQQLIRDYLEYLQTSLVEVKANLEGKNYPDIRVWGHGLKGSGGGYGFEMFTKLGSQIEMASIDEDRPLLEKLIPEFEAELEKEVEKFSS